MATTRTIAYAPGAPAASSGNALTNAIPGFGGLNSQATDLIRQLMSGQLSTGARRAIYDAGAERAAASGMPGSTGMANSLFANADLRNIGRASADQQQQGFQDFLALIQGLSGTVAPTAGQEIQAGQFGAQLDFQKQKEQNNMILENQKDYTTRYMLNQPRKFERKQLTPGYVPGGFNNISTTF